MKTEYRKRIEESAEEINEYVYSQLLCYNSQLMALRFLKSLLYILLAEYAKRRKRYFYRPEFWFIISRAKKKCRLDKKEQEKQDES